MQKTIYYRTNYNNKMSCHAHLHIDMAPREPLHQNQLDETIIEIRTSDNSHPPIKTKLNDLLRLPLNQLADIHTLPSHGMNAMEFVSKTLTENPKLNWDSPMAIYYYVKQE